MQPLKKIARTCAINLAQKTQYDQSVPAEMASLQQNLTCKHGLLVAWPMTKGH